MTSADLFTAILKYQQAGGAMPPHIVVGAYAAQLLQSAGRDGALTDAEKQFGATWEVSMYVEPDVFAIIPSSRLTPQHAVAQ